MEHNTVKSDYASLENVLKEALSQASGGKGSERHAAGQPFTDQPMFWIEKEFPSFQLGQAVKKIHESQRLETGAAQRELLGAINYLAAHFIFLESTKGFDRTHGLSIDDLEIQGIKELSAPVPECMKVKEERLANTSGEQLAPGVMYFDYRK